MQRNSGKEISQRVLQRETDDDAEERRGSEERAKIVVVINALKKKYE